MRKRIIALLLSGIVIMMMGCGINTLNKKQISDSGEENELEDETQKNEYGNKNLEENDNEESDDDSIRFTFGDAGEIAIIIDDNPSVDVWIHSEDAEECSLAFAYYYSSLSDEGMKDYNTSILVNYTDKLSVLWNKNENGETITGIDSDGSSTSELPDWIITDTRKFTLNKTAQADILSELQENTLQFLNK